MSNVAQRRIPSWVWAVLLAGAALAAYWPSLGAPFTFDDRLAILENASIRHLLPLGGALSPPPGASGASGRPLVNLSLALNYACGGLQPRGYHALNLGFHLLAGLTLYGLVRRTLRGDDRFAFLIALLWTVHPLLTETVACVIQRNEGMMGLFYLLTLYCFVRFSSGPSAEVPLGGTKEGEKAGWVWGWFSVFCCFFGMATKEVMATAPLIVLLYDRTFIAGSFAGAWKLRWRYYLGLAATWLLLGGLVLEEGASRGAAAGFGHGVTSWQYALTQSWAIPHYLRLAFWPDPLILDYGSDIVDRLGLVWPQALLVVGLVVGTGMALFQPVLLRPVWRGFGGRPIEFRWVGFLGAWFFLILAPSSSFLPLPAQTIAEHRMYLPLAAVVVAAMFALRAVSGRWCLAIGLVCAVTAGAVTVRRTTLYRDEVALWRQSVDHRPGNARAHTLLGIALVNAGRVPEAVTAYREALRLRPDYADAHDNLGNALRKLGRLPEAVAQFRRAADLEPENAEARNNLGAGLADAGQAAEAEAQYRQALRLRPAYAEAENNLGILLCLGGRAGEGLGHLERAVWLKPEFAAARNNLGSALAGAGRLPEAIVQWRTAVRLDPGLADAHQNLGLAWGSQGRKAEAEEQLQTAARLRAGTP